MLTTGTATCESFSASGIRGFSSAKTCPFDPLRALPRRHSPNIESVHMVHSSESYKDSDSLGESPKDLRGAHSPNPLSVMKLIWMLNALGLAALASTSMLDRRVPTGTKTVIAQMFEWTWDSVAAECTNSLGPAGYGFVQVSPAQEHITGAQWWTDYQPVSYILTSKRGDRAQYQNMITTCHAAGVRVIADTIWNHMTGVASGTGTAGSSFTQYDYPGVYNSTNFHYCGLEPDNNIVNYDNRLEVQTCQLDGLADLATETEYVRVRLAAYANDLISLGVDGLRLDAAKHMAATDVANITSRLDGAPYITQEVIWGAGEPIQPSEYVGIGDVQEFRYTTALQQAFTSTGISTLENLNSQGWVDTSVANVFVTNHDTERNGNSLNYNSSSNTYVLATVFSLAHPYGTPSILSSYTFESDNTDQGAPNGGAGTCYGTGGVNGWLCQHRWIAFSGMVGFRNNVGDASLTDWVAPTSQQIAFGRGSLGFVAINNADSAWTATFSTPLPAGSYCNVIDGAASGTTCTGSAFIVASDGTFTATIGARNALALHTGATGTGAGSIPVTFTETATTTWGENIFVTGSLPQLGSWSPSSAIALSSASYPSWQVTVSLPPGTTFQYKYIRIESDGSVVWESDPNRSATTSSSGSLSTSDSWR
ncbi:carbohydrate-binding module family 20 protein [Jaapia argillacea MUCL 33604]|uniref:Alpha-amylase n=1 Tax=Jaapia argillacea MUCL 33604 TaxID=933084 RepID=A0A067PW10_9AGAM|nr:carbohydrate-binding module family 20 protein [Jaapia argillacea MUCL 33604]